MDKKIKILLAIILSLFFILIFGPVSFIISTIGIGINLGLIYLVVKLAIKK